MTYTVLYRNDLPRADHTGTATFEGDLYGGAHLSFFWVDLPPGGGAPRHKHPCEEILIILEGRGTFTIDATTFEASAGQIIIVAPDTPHAFINRGDGPLRQIDILPRGLIITEWLPD